ncbi:MAG: tripartite tricarboxylate transporter substrate binding protein [Alcaligenaceae bacterium]|nr:tripartite tricarboxylate transporter substrate binding protein [Alcaligenaceae bacterium]
MKLKATLLFSCTLLAFGGQACAQATWPSQPVKLVVGYAPGGPVDTSARIFATYLGEVLKQSVVVENRPGASGMIAAESTSRATPDGYTFNFVASPTLTITPIIQKNTKINLSDDFSYVGAMVNYTNALVVATDSPFKSVQDLVEFARKNPQGVSFGSAGVGASNHLSAELLKQKTGTDMLHVPYRGNAPAMTDVIGGKITFMFDITSTAIAYVDGGRARALAVTSRERNPGMPNVPSMIEAGVQDYEVTGWYGLVGPKGLPDAIRSGMQQSMEKVAANPDFVKKMQEGGYTINLNTGTQLKERVLREYALWDSVISKAGIEANK